MVIVLWVAVAVVVANAILGAFLLIRFRKEGKRAVAARHRREESAHRFGPLSGSPHRHLA